MKNWLILVTLSLQYSVWSQQVLNSNFETWNKFVGYEDPAYFTSSNSVRDIMGDPPNSFKTNDSYKGSYALQITDLNNNSNYVKSLVSQAATLNSNKNLPTKLTGYYKCKMSGTDSGNISIVLATHDFQYNYVGSGRFYPKGIVSSYTKFEVPIVLHSPYLIGNKSVDYILEIQATDYEISKPKGPNSLTVDYLALDYTPNGLYYDTWENNISVNTSQNQVALEHLNPGENTISIYDCNGQLVATHVSSDINTSLYLPQLKGLYIIKIANIATSQVHTSKIII